MNDEVEFDYDGLRFRPCDPDRVPGAPGVLGVYDGGEGRVWAEYSGGSVAAGRLVGTTRPDGTIDGAYCQIGVDGRAAAGIVTSVPERLADGRVRLREHWRRTDGTSGVSVIDQADDGDEAG